ncbi:hypothetical protein [Labrys miyagiensis]|uniref:hypothetical protein n=1 Tax=Labrys miyagiensis TaxID=346912 RepID=UPI0024E13C6B|nr:hypothetical protein [Labrys miyagiensis]
MDFRRELYRSSNGDLWSLARDPADGAAMIVHQANGPSGAAVSFITLRDFLASGANGPEHQALLRLIGSLVTTHTPTSRNDNGNSPEISPSGR